MIITCPNNVKLTKNTTKGGVDQFGISEVRITRRIITRLQMACINRFSCSSGHGRQISLSSLAKVPAN